MANLVLGVKDLSDVHDLLKKCNFPETKWYVFGLKLGLQKNTLEIIEKNHPHDVSRCLIECLSEWLHRADDVDSKGGVTIDSLINALKSMEANAVASAVRLITPSAPTAATNKQGYPPLSPIALKDIPDDRPKVSELIKFYELLKKKELEFLPLLDADTIEKIRNAVNDYEGMSLLIRAIDELLNEMRATRIIKSPSQKRVETLSSPELEPQQPSLTTQPPVTTPICKLNHSPQIQPCQSQLMHVDPHSFSTTIQLSSKEEVAETIESLDCQFAGLVLEIRKRFDELVLNKKLKPETQLLKLFKDANHEDAVRLLPYIKNLKQLQDEVTIKISPFDTYQVEATLLHMASWNGWLDVTGDLITKYGCDQQERDTKGNTCLHYAAMGNHVSVMEYLIIKYSSDPTVTNENGDTILHKAAYYGSLDVIKFLIINHRCNPKSTNLKKGETLLHCAAEHVDILKYLINDEGSCNPMATTFDGKTPLHYAANFGCSASVEFLLSTGKCDPLAKDKYGKTPLQLAKERRQRGGTDTVPIFKQFGDIKSSHPIDSYVNVLLVGNFGAGKSTLVHVINDTATGSIVLGSFRNVGGVVPSCFAGIIPYKLQHRTLGSIILHDFAGHSEYYSSHSDIIENLLQGFGGVFLIVVNILEKEAVKQLHQWLTIVRNEAQKALNQCHIIVIVSHVDEISNSVERRRRKEEMQEIIVRERCDSVFLDCRKLGGSGVNSFFKKLSSACESIRSTSERNSSLYCYMMYGLLEERKENILTLSDVMSAGKDSDDYVLPDKREDVLDVLHSLHSTGLISVLKSEDKVWVVVNKGILLTEVNGILFVPMTFKEHIDIASNTGIVSVSGLTKLFPKYDPDMLIYFLKNMGLCQEINPSFLRMTNLHQLAVDEEEEGETERRGERLLFLPCLLSNFDILMINDEAQETQTDKLLDIKDLATVLQELTSNQQFDYTDWYQLGLYLGLYEHTLRAIEEESRGRLKKCLLECIASWLKGEDGVAETRGGGSSWTSLVAALDAMGEREVANNIRIKYL
uniref:Death domain-containing protein n=1 Tax=Amphimedon queenslandica TaxID=400682 RepID=A0A1X7U6K1_AMPQE